jgi:crotonobetaine/carnitine-CoA ligase
MTAWCSAGVALERLADADADAPFVVTDDGALARGEMLRLALGAAGAFSTLGIRTGARVAVMLENRVEFLATWFGLNLIGAIEVPVNPEAVGDRLRHVLGHSGATLLVVEAERLAAVRDAVDGSSALRTVVVVGDPPAGVEIPGVQILPWTVLEHDPERAERVDVAAGDVAAVMYTSGSTGPAKGVMVTHGQHHANGRQPAGLFEIGEADVVYCCLPLHHNMAQGYAIMPALLSGAAVRLAPRFDCDAFWDDVRGSGATVLPVVGVMLALLAKRPARPDDGDHALRIGYGVPIPAELHEPFEQRFGVRLVHCYGSTEATIVAWGADADRRVGAAGTVLDDFDVRILDDDDEPVADGQQGEICVRPRHPNTIFAGYWEDAERTARSCRNLWFHTGDRGWFDADGRLWFADRIDDVIRRMGEFVSSREVEDAVNAHEAVELAAAYGVRSELVEEEVMVTVTLVRGASVTPDEIREWCRDRLPRFAIPRFVRIVAAMPVTPTGKLEKFRLRAAGVTDDADDARGTANRRSYA